MTRDQIKEIALANGFKLKEQPDGRHDLNPYVYDAVAECAKGELIKVRFELLDIIANCDGGTQELLDICDEIIERHIAELTEITK